jgi:hypothetical protein
MGGTNGTLRTTTTTVPAIVPVSGQIRIGQNNTTETFSGRLALARVYSKQLSATEYMFLYNYARDFANYGLPVPV